MPRRRNSSFWRNKGVNGIISFMERQNLRLCEGCPALPNDVSVRLVEAEVIDPSADRYRDVRPLGTPETLLCFVVTDSSDPNVDTGSKANLVVAIGGGGKNEADSRIAACNGRGPGNIVQKVLGIKNSCGAFGKYSTF